MINQYRSFIRKQLVQRIFLWGWRR